MKDTCRAHATLRRGFEDAGARGLRKGHFREELGAVLGKKYTKRRVADDLIGSVGGSVNLIPFFHL